MVRPSSAPRAWSCSEMRSMAFLIRRWTALRARSAAPPARRDRPPQLGAQHLDLLARPGRARAVAERLGLGHRLLQVLEAALVGAARLVVQQFAGIARVDRLAGAAARALPDQVQHVDLA